MSGFAALVGDDGTLVEDASLGGSAPPTTLDGRVWLAADARIDGVGVPDREAILAAYERFGERCPEHLVGDYAFAIWDAPRRRPPPP